MLTSLTVPLILFTYITKRPETAKHHLNEFTSEDD